MNDNFHCLYPLLHLPRDGGDVRGGSFDVIGCDVATLGSLRFKHCLSSLQNLQNGLPFHRALNIFLEQFRVAFKIIQNFRGREGGLDAFHQARLSASRIDSVGNSAHATDKLLSSFGQHKIHEEPRSIWMRPQVMASRPISVRSPPPAR